MTQGRLERQIMAHARSGICCIRCHRQDGTVCGRHLNGLRQHSLGKGRSVKCHPFAVADFCNACDLEFCEGSVPKADWAAYVEKSEEFLYFCLLTIIRRAEMGVVRAA